MHAMSESKKERKNHATKKKKEEEERCMVVAPAHPMYDDTVTHTHSGSGWRESFIISIALHIRAEECPSSRHKHYSLRVCCALVNN